MALFPAKERGGERSTARADSFAGAKEKKKHRPASVGMTVFLHIDVAAVVQVSREMTSSNVLVNDKDAF